jgi:hypothetical protein
MSGETDMTEGDLVIISGPSTRFFWWVSGRVRYFGVLGIRYERSSLDGFFFRSFGCVS